MNLNKISFTDFKLTSVDWLNTIPNPKKLKILSLYNNNIEPTDIAVFSKFTSLGILKIGAQDAFTRFNDGYRNKFYGSLKAYRNLTKLHSICFEATDVNEGLEYLPLRLAYWIKDKKSRRYDNIECSPHRTNAKCKAIQDQLKPYDYDLLAWQLAHPAKMLRAQPELFTHPKLKKDWLASISEKITATQAKIDQEIKETKKKRLESKIKLLAKIKEQIEAYNALPTKEIKQLEQIISQFEKDYLVVKAQKAQEE